MDPRRLKLQLLLPMLGILLLGAALGYAFRPAPPPPRPDPQEIAVAALLSIREQGRLSGVRRVRLVRRDGAGHRHSDCPSDSLEDPR